MQCSNCAKNSLIKLAKATKLRPIPQIRYFDRLPTRLQVWSLIFLVSRCSYWLLIQKKPRANPRTRLHWLRKTRLKIWRLQWIDTPPAWRASLFLKGVHWNNELLIEVLRGQPIKLIQVVSYSEFHENWWKDCQLGCKSEIWRLQ